jgi:hypothetical protein
MWQVFPVPLKTTLLTESTRERKLSHKERVQDRGMRYLASAIGLLGTLVLVAPFH